MSEPAAEEYTIGWICALQEEFEAACRMLDDEFDGLEAADPNDDNTYVFGRIHKHNVVIGCLPSGIYGTTSAACVARDMVRSFPNLRFALMVGIGGGAPTRERDIRLGDVVVSEPKAELGGVLQYDLGKRLSDGEFKRTGQLNAPPRVLLGALPEVRRRHNDPRKRHSMAENLTRMDDMPEYSRPTSDKLYRVESRHRSGKTCDECDSSGLIERSPRPSDRTIAIHYGTIASGNTVMKDAAERDQYANDPALNVLCFEMEAAGLMNNFPCLVIRGICDYSDDHKNDEWHNYAALTAAAYARDLLGIVRPQKVAQQPAWAGKMELLLGEVREGVKEVLHHQRSEEEENLLQWLSPIDHAKTQIDRARGRDPGTGAGKWLLDSPEFQGWLDAGNKTLFCPGIPGAGKTVLASIVIENLLGRREQADSKPIGVAFIYLDFKQQLELVQLLGSILRQLAADHSSALGSIKKLHDTCKAQPREVYIHEVRDILHSIVPSFSRLFIVIDALDEAEHHLGETLLDEVFRVQQAHGANVFATSRHIPDIERQFEGAQKLEIRAADEDVWNYVDSYMVKLPRFVRQSPELQEDARTEIVKAIDGMFLLATLHLDSLVGARSVTAFRDALGSLPTGNNAYDRAYDLALERIEGQARNRRDLAIEVLSWVACARVHLTTVQLQHALAVIVGSTHFDQCNISDMDDVVSVCAGLVVVDPGRDIVRLVHYTTQEYFEREKSKRLPDAQSHITASCLAYLSLDFFERMSWRGYQRDLVRFPDYPFHEYAALNWGYHACEASALLPTVLEFLRCGKIGVSKAVLRELVFDDTTTYGSAPATPIGLHLAAYFGLLEAVKLLADQTCLNSKDEALQTPLSWAASNGQVDMVSYLLNTGKVDAESRCPRLRTPLHHAAGKGHVGVMEALLTIAGTDINARDVQSCTPLHLAVREEQGPAVQWLLDHGADLNSKDFWDDTPLRRAVRYDNVAAMRQLLGRDQIGLESREDCRGLLPFAASSGSMAAIKLLVDEYNMDVNSKDSDGRTPLLVALRDELVDRAEVADFFLTDTGTDFISSDCLGRTPLSYAAENNYLVAVKILLTKDGVDVNSRDNEGRSALSRVADRGRGHLSIAQLLVEAGADVDSKDDGSRSILSWVAWYGHSAMAQLLVQAGVDIDSKDECGRTSLLEAAYQLHLIAIELHEIDSETSKHSRGVCECTDQCAYVPRDREPFTSVLRKYKAIFDLLVENGADVEVRDQDGQTIESYRKAERGFWSSLRDGIQDQPQGQRRECPQGYSSPDGRDTDNCFFPYW